MPQTLHCVILYSENFHRDDQKAAKKAGIETLVIANFHYTDKIKAVVLDVNRFYPKTQLSWLARLDHSHCNSADPLTDGLEVCCVFYRMWPSFSEPTRNRTTATWAEWALRHPATTLRPIQHRLTGRSEKLRGNRPVSCHRNGHH